MGYFGVLEDEILKRDGMIVSAKRVFSLEANSSQVIIKGQGINFIMVAYNNVVINCSFIADLSEQSPFYQEIMKIVRKEVASEN